MPTALALLEEADRRGHELGVQPTARALSRAAALSAAGLTKDARRVADETVAQFREGGDESYLAECLVLLADIALLDDDPGASRVAAEEAARLFETQNKPGWASLARAAVARAGLAEGGTGAALAPLASEAARHLDEMGLVDQATMAHAVAGRLWLSEGDAGAGIEELDCAGSRRKRGTAAARLAAWEALGEARLAAGDRRGAMTAMQRALAVVEDQQASLSATELRAHISVHARAAARLGLRLALDGNRPPSIWQWMERHRANSLRLSPARPPRDEVLASLLAELRAVTEDIASCVTDGGDPSVLLAHQTDLERRARERAWKASGTAGAKAGRAARIPELVAALGDAALIELGDIDGQLHGVVLAGGRWHHRRLAATPDVRRELQHVRLSLRRLAYGDANRALAAGASAQLSRAGAALDHLLMAPLADLIGTRPVVMVPTGELHSVPWATLPGLAGRAVSVAPSAKLWLTARSGRGRSGPVQSGPGPSGRGQSGRDWHHSRAVGSQARRREVVVAGPGLPGAEREAVTIGSLYPTAEVLTGRQANVRAVTAALEGASLAHIAAHARFRADNGLWSSLELADGALTVYELEQLRHPPRVVVLSACQSGLSAVHAGDELIGLVAALLGLGAYAVVASVVPVEDRASEELMLAFHHRLGLAQPPAVALAGARVS